MQEVRQLLEPGFVEILREMLNILLVSRKQLLRSTWVENNKGEQNKIHCFRNYLKKSHPLKERSNRTNNTDRNIKHIG